MLTVDWKSISIQQVQQLISNRVDPQCSVATLEQTNRGFVNKTFIVTLSNSQQFILKMMNPTWYFNKTFNEVITMYFVRKKTSIPVPNIICWECDRKQSEIGYEFILMEKKSGMPLEICWETLTHQQKVDLLNQIVDILDQLRQTQFNSVGNFYLSKMKCNEQSGVEDIDLVLSPLVTFQQLADATDTVPIVGPFSNFTDYILAYFDVHFDIMLQQDDPDIRPFLEPLRRFRKFIHSHKEGLLGQHEDFYLTHGDLTASNILVTLDIDGNYHICSIIDWEWAMSAPCDVEFQRGFNFIKADSQIASVFWKMLEERKIDTKMKLDNFLQGIRGTGSKSDSRHHIFAVERFVSKLVYLKVYYSDPNQQKIVKDEYLHLMGNILTMYDCL